eukprot:CAMPEP_0171698354 /NCGR_PEP_ID=MMETSP0991-20121206/9315_1 /TAXON_ID=483369 /ORGANISM="non described non described, Strain CCMP2098" /LENGTH=106 /DNA_ID=CAMNT_0012287219 /DNA_START=329 /DNA_END=649 /DNA_ORIENTATION=+
MSVVDQPRVLQGTVSTKGRTPCDINCSAVHLGHCSASRGHRRASLSPPLTAPLTPPPASSGRAASALAAAAVTTADTCALSLLLPPPIRAATSRRLLLGDTALTAT